MAALTDEVIRSMTAEQRANLEKLMGLLLEEGKVEEDIQKMFRKGFKYEPYGDGLAISVLEDEDDLRVRNIFKEPEEQDPIYRKRNELRTAIRGTLEESVSLKLDYLSIIKEGRKNYSI
jgi:hypothetical protein